MRRKLQGVGDGRNIRLPTVELCAASLATLRSSFIYLLSEERNSRWGCPADPSAAVLPTKAQQ
jgi:hypothetical protein